MTTRKTKRVLSDISFEGKDAHLALVSKDQGGPANGADYKLVIKSAKYTDEHLEKASKIRVTMDITDFLHRFYGLWRDDAEVLAQALGLDTENDEMTDDATYEDWIASRVAAIEVIKQLLSAEDVDKALADLEPESYLSLLRSQETLEKAFKKIDKAQAQNSKAAVKTAVSEEGTSTAVVKTKEVEKQAEDVSSSETKVTEKSNMTKEVKVVEQETTVEMVEKSALDSVQKALAEQAVALEKALETVKQFEKEKQDALLKSRKDALVSVVKDADKAEALFKGLVNVESTEIFDDVIKALDGLMQVQKNSVMFKELGADSVESSKQEETALMKAVKAAAAKNT